MLEHFVILFSLSVSILGNLIIDELNKLTAYYAKKYYDDDDPEISDFEYDMLMLELRNLEKQFPDLITSDSLTQHVGGTVKEGFEKVEHEVPLQSLQDVFSFDELNSFDESPIMLHGGK